MLKIKIKGIKNKIKLQKNKTWVASQEALSFKSEARLGYAQFEDGGSARAIASLSMIGSS
jgi:hypothetical protein